MTDGCQDPRHLPAPAPRCVLPHRAYDDGCERTATADQPALLCSWHVDRLAGYVTDVRDDWLLLDLIAEAGSAPKDAAGRGGRTKNPSPPAPANLDVLVLRDPRSHQDVDSPDDRAGQPWAVPYLAEVYCTRVRDERPLSRIVMRPVRHADGRTFPVPTTVPALVPSSVIARLDMLARHHEWIVQQDWVGEYVTEITELRTALRTALRDRTHRKIGRCYLPDKAVESTNCGGTLLEENGSGVVKCNRCNESWRTAREQARLAVALDREQPAMAKSPVE